MTRDLQIPSAGDVEALAARAGFEICGIASAGPSPDFSRFLHWVDAGFAGAMSYLTDYRAGRRETVRNLLPGALSVICVGKLYNGPEPYSTEFTDTERGWISRYAWGEDYHHILRAGLQRLAGDLVHLLGPFEWKACVDSAPVLERSLARQAGLGWIGKNTCLINQARGSWFYLGELITSLPLEPASARAADRCGSCTRCIDACPTAAIIPARGIPGHSHREHAHSEHAGRQQDGYQIDSRLCISYLTIELRGTVDEQLRGLTGRHVFGCDICQDVCPWNRKAQTVDEPEHGQAFVAPPLARLACLSEAEFRAMFRNTAVERARYRGFLRNVAIAMGNSGSAALVEPLGKLAQSLDPMVAEHATCALRKLTLELAAPKGTDKPCVPLP